MFPVPAFLPAIDSIINTSFSRIQSSKYPFRKSSVTMVSAFLFLLASFALPFLALSDTPASANDTVTNDLPFLCTPTPPFRRVIIPDSQNCAGALRALPSRPQIANIHTGGVDDGFQLPTFERYKNCEVLIEGATANTNVESSWLEIGLAATQLNDACLVVNVGRVGGLTYTGGPYGRAIKITLRGYARPKDDQSNGTVATA
ncbi:MAG: hypothetical protein Q9220_000543 [cf. Caloplaca sp. 1 TL-2023]